MKTKSKIYFLLLFFLFTIFLLLFFTFYLLREIKKQSQSLLSLKQNLAEKEVRLENIQNLKLAEKEIAQDLERIEKIFFNKEAPIDFINFLEKVSQDCEVVIEKISPLPSTKAPTPHFSYLEFQMTGVSSFKGAVCFLRKLEFGPYLIQVLSLNLGKLTKEELKNETLQGPFLNLGIVFRAYTK